MSIIKSLALAAVTVAALSSVVAHASVIGTLGSNQGGSAFVLTSGNVTGGLLTAGLSADASRPSNTIGQWLAGEPNQYLGSAIVSFGIGVSDVSFEWGTPDGYNTLIVKEANGATTNFTTANLGINGETYVNFVDTGSAITSLTFDSQAYRSFEAANFTTTAVPEPATIALLGFGLLGFASARRKSANNNA
ncbi:PEP-CTERM sorting domain-containing protein [Glaciimonas sp. Gout2]|uniref:PEP-CTERM sorting domain-containing protein n=1 Tax=unclassified Glaciimonas TaxID=2644401 RepID=UPI002AB5CE8F|nr:MULTISPECIES: PEP-CTERM sorting domain-containing protein [unclassified Glaciimonas]MDY7544649.1 PEP-CTERM sorting domain-containing protein [Glaciimonas sp. CA11.2]MEB0012053.1 PEP-CTERM sorting domain-containing protein [Glaciimonas sp. Cout2]MEB0084286.1 PEP-CTERM sorting domain-containing protein [Glaciimonas sp. Gout2]